MATNFENLKKLAEGLGADASKCSTNLGALNVISKALGGSGDAETNSQAIEEIAQAAPAAMEQNVVWADGITTFKTQTQEIFKCISVPDGVTSLDVSAFGGCYNLKKVTLPDSVTAIGGAAFAGCSELETVNIPKNVKVIPPQMFGGCSSLNDVTIESDLETIGGSAFASCATLPEITLPNSVTEIAEDAFKDCANLTEINIHKPENSISGAPWGATNAQVNWLG